MNNFSKKDLTLFSLNLLISEFKIKIKNGFKKYYENDNTDDFILYDDNNNVVDINGRQYFDDVLIFIEDNNVIIELHDYDENILSVCINDKKTDWCFI